jgi:hypothetical protein
MYPSLSVIDAAEVRRWELLTEASQMARSRAETNVKGATVMRTLVNASYGIAMGQRPSGPERPISLRGAMSNTRPQERPLLFHPAGAHRVPHILRALVAAIGNPGQLCALATSRVR